MDFATLPPEVISTLLWTGPGAGSLLDATAAWEQLATELSSTASSYRTVIAAIAWTGPSSVAMRSTARGYVDWLTSTASHAQQSSMATQAAAMAYQTAHESVVNPAIVIANRTQLVALQAANLFGQLTALIAANEAAYEQMWAQDTTAMTVYSAQSNTATAALPTFTTLQTTTNTADASPPSNVDLSPSGWIGQLILSTISSGPYQLPTSVLALLTGLWAVSSVAAVPDVLNRISNSIGIPAVVAPVIPTPAPPVRANIGGSAQIGRLSVPTSWAHPPESRTPGTQQVVVPGKPGATPIPVPLPMPLGTGQRNGERRTKTDPEYGFAPKVVHRTPAGG